MSPSPRAAGDENQLEDYRQAWQQITDLTRAGKSFSGRERNCCYLSTDGPRFANVSAAAGFDFSDDARGLGVVDWDHDGDLDVWVVNRSAPQLRFLRNESAAGQHFVGFKLEGRASNRDAIGARVEIEMKSGQPRRLVRTVRAGNGFLSQSSKRLHVGLGGRTDIASVTVRWPTGKRETIRNVAADGHFEIVEGTGTARRLDLPARAQQLVASKLEPLPLHENARIILGRRVPPPRYKFYHTLDGQPRAIDQVTGRPRLIMLWATWCRGCVKEMQELATEAEELRGYGLEIVALNVDSLQPASTTAPEQIAAALQRIDWPYDAGIATPDVVESFSLALKAFVLRQEPLSLPTSFLIDSRGQLAVIYKGSVETRQLTEDLGLLNLSSNGIFQAACPFPGRWQPDVPQIARQRSRRR